MIDLIGYFILFDNALMVNGLHETKGKECCTQASRGLWAGGP